MIIRVELLSDASFGSGKSVPGGEDSSILVDEQGFPYMKGSTIKGLIRENYQRYLGWTGIQDAEKKVKDLFGYTDMSEDEHKKTVRISDIELSDDVREAVSSHLEKMAGKHSPLEYMSYLRVLTKLEDGMVKDGSMRTIRCLRKGLIFYGTIDCPDSRSEEEIRQVLPFIKWIGGEKTRGLGEVSITELEASA